MENLNEIESTLFVPLLGRIFASENYPNLFEDKKSLSIKDKLPKDLCSNEQTEYTLLAGATRSVNMDRIIRKFIHRHENGVIVNIGCGLDTAFFRNNNCKNKWYEVDLKEVIEYRNQFFEETTLDKYIVADVFDIGWIKKIREENPQSPILIVASGFFYFFEYDKVVELFTQLKNYGDIEIVFDTVSKSGSKRMHHYMKKVGHEKLPTYFYVDDGEKFAESMQMKLLLEEPYYRYIYKNKFKLITKITMNISDKFGMVKMIQLKLNYW